MDRMNDSKIEGPLAESAAASVTTRVAVARFSLRAKPAARGALGEALGAELPLKIGRSVQAGDVVILCLGPDEWLIQAPEAERSHLTKACLDVYTTVPHSLTDITDREITLTITGPKAAELLTLGCPRDIEALPVGEARRTVFDGVSIVLWRDGEKNFRLDVWRSFAPHVADLLATGCEELAAE